MKFVTESDLHNPPPEMVEVSPLDPALVARIRAENIARLQRLNFPNSEPVTERDFTWLP